MPRTLVRTAAILSCLATLASAASAEAFRPSKTHRERNYGEFYLGGGGSGGLSYELVPSLGGLVTLGGGINLDRSVGLTLGAAVGYRNTLDGDIVITTTGHIDVEVMLDLGQVEPYALIGAAAVHIGDAPLSSDNDEAPPPLPGLRVGAGVDIWTGRGNDRGSFFVPILGIRAVYAPSIALGPRPFGINQDLMVDLQLKFHFNIDLGGGGGGNCLNPVGF